jgi:membrane-associated protease RseP (regulator of RpoE activity)
MKPVILRAALALLCVASSHAEDDVPFPLGTLGGKAFQTEGSSLLRVTEVTAGGPAAAAGLQVGDQLYSVNGEKLPVTGVRYNDGWRGAVTELGYAIERAESSTGALALGVLRPGTGNLTINATLPLTTAWRPSYPVGDVRATSYYDKVCADIHSRTTSSADGSFGANTGWHGLILLAHPEWNSTSGATPYRNSINKLRDRCVNYLAGRQLEPVESGQPGYVNAGLENWDVTASAMFLGEYRRKSGDTGVDAAVQRTVEMLANRIQGYAQTDDDGVLRNKLGLMGHGGVSGDYPHVSLSGLNIINSHALVAMGILKGAGANFTAASGGSGYTIDQKFP